MLTPLLVALSLQVSPPTDPVFDAETLRAELEDLHTTLEASQYDLYAITPRDVFDRHRAHIHESLTEPLTLTETQILFQTYLALARIGHTRIDFPAAAWSGHVSEGGVMFPVSLRVHQGRVWVESDQSGLDTLSVGDEVLALEGEPNAIWMPRLTRHLSADTPHLAHTLLELYLPGLIWIEYPEARELSLTIRKTSGETVDVVVPLLDAHTRSQHAETTPDVISLDGFSQDFPTQDIAYLRPGPFYNTEPGGVVWDNTAYVARIEAAYETLIQSGASQLILDLRDNPGGDSSFSDPVIAPFADEDFRFASRFTIRVSDATTASNAARLAEDPGATQSVSAQFAALYANSQNGETVEFDIPFATPHPALRFEGEVYVLVNRYSFSNAVNAAALIQDYGFGLIAGETTADMATTYGAMETFTLPRTGIQVGYPKAHIIRPNGETRVHPVTPDIPLDIPPLRGSQDVVLQQLIDHIEGRHRQD